MVGRRREYFHDAEIEAQIQSLLKKTHAEQFHTCGVCHGLLLMLKVTCYATLRQHC